MSRSQSLPMSFIVLAVIGMLVLVMLVFFIYSTRQSAESSINPQKAYGQCDSKCVLEQQYASRGGSYPHTDSQYCSLEQVVEGYGDSPVRCDEMEAYCSVDLRNGSQMYIDCSDDEAQLSSTQP